ncbi:dehydration-responsive element-binding protein 2F-like protein [Corchorus olitorius]|uniref:Dehydration-responsive element-binding protein 2F-like protein n=1 Tax=Corchorus olitorius TaxID=93759 RepID=A0A1R3HIT5_9ROSI|nr:dehydration-responsive element-binding protein 2F-like protein [Corchorus olitorius]
MFPSCGLLNLNAQPSVHVIHQRLQELKKNGVFNPTSSESKTTDDSIQIITNDDELTPAAEDNHQIMKEKDVQVSSDKPQIDLHEFLQQLGILREEKQSDHEIEGVETTEQSLTATDSSIKDYDEISAFAENNFNWDAMIEMHGVSDYQFGAESSFQVHDFQEDPTFPTSIWNF